MGERVGREVWKCWMRKWCERMDRRDSVEMKTGDVGVFVRFFGGFGVDAMNSF